MPLKHMLLRTGAVLLVYEGESVRGKSSEGIKWPIVQEVCKVHASMNGILAKQAISTHSRQSAPCQQSCSETLIEWKFLQRR